MHTCIHAWIYIHSAGGYFALARCTIHMLVVSMNSDIIMHLLCEDFFPTTNVCMHTTEYTHTKHTRKMLS